MDLLSTIGLAVREARLRKRITQAEAARAAGVHRITVSTLERAQAPDIGVRKLSALLNVLGLELVVRERGQSYTLDDLARELSRPPAPAVTTVKRVRKTRSPLEEK